MFTIEETARKAALSERTVRALLAAEAVRSVTRDGVVLIKWSDFENFLSTTAVSEWFWEAK